MTTTLLSRALQPSRLAHHAHHVHILRQTFATKHPPITNSERRRKPTDTNKAPVHIQDGSDTDIIPGSHVVDVCRKHAIDFPSQLRTMPGLKTREMPYKLVVLSSQRHCFDIKSMKYLDSLKHPWAQSVLDFYIADKCKPLWLSIWATGASPFPCKTAEKKLRHALREALAAHGYDRDGKRIPTDEPSATIDMYGTLRIKCNEAKAVCNTKFADLVGHANIIISHAELQLRRGKAGEHLLRVQNHRHPRLGQDQRRDPKLAAKKR